MTTMLITLGGYALMLLILAYVGYKRTKNTDDYLLAGRGIHPLVMALSYGATFISTSAIIGFGGAAGQFGLSLLWLTAMTIIVGVFIAFIVFGKKTRQVGHKLGAGTMPELFGLRFNSPFMQGYAGVLIFLFMPVYASAVLKGIVDYVAGYFALDFTTVLVVVAAVAAINVIFGGLKGIMYADAFQGALIFAGMAYLILRTYSMLGGVQGAHTALEALPTLPGVAEQTAGLTSIGFAGWTAMPVSGTPLWWNIVSTLVAGVGIGVLAQPQLSVRFMTVKSGREINRAVLAGGIFILCMTGGAFVTGALSNVAFYRATGNIAITAAGANDSIIPMFIKTFLPPWFGSTFLVVLLAASMSTLTALCHAMGTALGRDVLKQSLRLKADTITLTRTAMAVGIVISVALAYLSSKLDVGMAIIAQGTSLFYGLCAAAFLPVYVATLYCKSFTKKAAIASMVAGSAISLFWLFFIQEKTAASLQLCNLLFSTTSLVKGTPLGSLAMVDAIVVALPASSMVALVVWGLAARRARAALPAGEKAALG